MTAALFRLIPADKIASVARIQKREIGVVRWRIVKQLLPLLEQVAMQTPRLARASHLTGPDIQAVGLLDVQTQLLKAFLNPLPTLLPILLCQRIDL